MTDARVKAKKAMHVGTTVPVNITFGGSTALDDVTVNSPVIAHYNADPAQRDHVAWYWQDQGSTVSYAVIQFKDTNQTWFGGSNKKRIDANPPGGTSGSHKVPVPSVVGPGTHSYEYLVLAYDANDNLLYAVDPDVVTENP